MKHPYHTTRVLVIGALCGPIWEGPYCGLGLTAELPKAPTFADGLRDILRRRSGDFQSARFTGDTIVYVERVRVRGRSTKRNIREIPITAIPGAETMTAPGTFACDYSG